MLQKIRDTVNLAKNMGMRYVAFRSKHELLARSGLLQKKFPVNSRFGKMPTLAEWKAANIPFFFADRESIKQPKRPEALLAEKYQNLLKGQFTFFSSLKFDLGNNYNWTTNPETCFTYDHLKHWTKIPDFSSQAGDIKYVWEKSRFTFLYDIIRYDYHFNTDCSEIVFKEIVSWIDHNPINCGPNYRCSQEISLRLFNWTFALYYYKHSQRLTEDIFQQIMHHMYWQIRHVYSNIHFSRIAVRNNHAITETLGLYIFGLLFPFFRESGKWKKDGKRWFEKEIAYQVYPDGSFLQFSMNYHRVVVQLLTWGIRLSEVNHEFLQSTVYARAKASLQFLYNCMNREDGTLPNYGANDGALFFPLNHSDFRDYRPQLHALSTVLGQGKIDENNEDQWWYGIAAEDKGELSRDVGIVSYTTGGYYLLREEDAFTFLRCGCHKDRPGQADNLHLDLWVNGRNILRDSGSYKYNTDEETIRYFFGTTSHNTVMLGDYDQMKKGRRFIWYFWSQSIYADWKEYDEYFEFKGAIKAFQHVSKDIVHTRTVRKYKGQWRWEVTDRVDHNTSLAVHQLWHPAFFIDIFITFTAVDENQKQLQAETKKGWHSSEYGIKEEEEMLDFATETRLIHTIIEIKEKVKI